MPRDSRHTDRCGYKCYRARRPVKCRHTGDDAPETFDHSVLHSIELSDIAVGIRVIRQRADSDGDAADIVKHAVLDIVVGRRGAGAEVVMNSMPPPEVCATVLAVKGYMMSSSGTRWRW